jgi:hypothetical protein
MAGPPIPRAIPNTRHWFVPPSSPSDSSLHAPDSYSPAAEVTAPLKATVSDFTSFVATAGPALAAIITPANTATSKPNFNLRLAVNITKNLRTICVGLPAELPARPIRFIGNPIHSFDASNALALRPVPGPPMNSRPPTAGHF